MSTRSLSDALVMRFTALLAVAAGPNRDAREQAALQAVLCTV